jgi:hypothetical protein
MSRNDWERGEIKMSVKEFGSVRRDMVAFVNRRQDMLLSGAQGVYSSLKALGKGKRGFDWAAQLESLLRFVGDGAEEIHGAILPYEYAEGRGYAQSKRPKAPKKKQFAHVKQSVERIDLGEASIGFDRKRRVIHWSTGENNHAVDRAHSHAVAKAFFSRLDRVVWTRGTGGELIGNDEYNIDAGRDYAGGGASYVTRRFGSAEKSKHAAR